MLCDNCGKKEANVRYWENINGKKRELNLCDECSKKLGIGQIDFSMPIGISSFLGGFMEDFQTKEFMPMLNELKTLKCNSCGYTFDDIINTGRLGCKNCYDIFQDRLDPIIKKIQGDNRHVGRIGKIIDSKIDNINDDKEESMKKDIKNGGNSKEDNKELSKIEKLQEELKKAIAEEKYEEAAKIRDEIKKLES
jgi:protein arginine kinase activator